jgi:hypothetical protein
MKPWPNFGPKIKVSFRIWINIAQSGHRFRLGMKELMTMCCYGRKKLRQSLYQNTIGHVHLTKRRSNSKGENNSGYDLASDSCHSCSESNNNAKSVVEQSEITLFSRPSVRNLQKIRSVISDCSTTDFALLFDSLHE